MLVALLCSLPHWVALLHNHGDYSPFSVSPSVSALTFDETHAYAPAARRFALTGRMQAETDNYEHRNLSAGIPFLPEALLGGIGALLGGLERAFIAADIVFPPLVFLMFYWFTGSLLTESALRLLVAWSSVLIPFGLLNSLWMGDDALLAPLEITRTPQPELSFVVLLAAAMLLARALVEQQSRKWLIGAGIASGAVVYCYYFYTIAWSIALGLLIVAGLLWRNRPLWSRSVQVLALMLLLAIPYAVVTVNGNRQGGQAHLLARMGLYSYAPHIFPLVAVLVLTVALLLIGKRLYRNRPGYFVLAILVCGALYGMNFQIISGFETQPWHFWKRLALPLCYFLGISFAAHFAENTRRIRARACRGTAYLVLFLLILETAARLTYAALATAPLQRASQPDLALLDWVRANLPRDQVIGTVNPELILLIPAIAPDYTYVPSGLRSLTSSDEIVERYFELDCLLGLSPHQVESAAAVANHLGHSTELLHVLGLSYTGDPEVYRSFVNGYRKFQAACVLPKWQLDLVVTSSPEEAAAVHRNLPLVKTLYQNSRYELLAAH